MTYDIRLYRQAKRDLDECDVNTREELTDEIRNVAEYQNPMSHRKVKKLDCGEKIYRLRVGDKRVIFGVVSRAIIVFSVTSRSDRTYNKSNMDHIEDLWKEAKNTVPA